MALAASSIIVAIFDVKQSFHLQVRTLNVPLRDLSRTGGLSSSHTYQGITR